MGYSTLEFAALKRCPHCNTMGDLNLERHKSLGIVDGKVTVLNQGKLVYHCRTCGCNTEREVS